MDAYSAYEELGFDPELRTNSPPTENEIQAAYRRRAQATHPDRDGGNAEDFRRATEAFEFLTQGAAKEAAAFEELVVSMYKAAIDEAVNRVLQRQWDAEASYSTGIPVSDHVPKDAINAVVNAKNTAIVAIQKDKRAIKAVKKNLKKWRVKPGLVAGGDLENLIERAFEHKLAFAEKSLIHNERTVKALAEVLFRLAKYELDPNWTLPKDPAMDPGYTTERSLFLR